jgi:hypothetical protein
VCTVDCVDDCPDGWSCKAITLGGGSDLTSVCVPKEAKVCEPCVTPADCGGIPECAAPSEASLAEEGGTCLLACVGEDAACPLDCGYCGDQVCSACGHLRETKGCPPDCASAEETCNGIDDDVDGESCDDGDAWTALLGIRRLVLNHGPMRRLSLFIAIALLPACSSGSNAALDDARWADAPVDAPAALDAAADAAAVDSPGALPFDFRRSDVDGGEALTADELDGFSRAMRDFYWDTDYFGWLLRMSHGVDASTGMRDFRLWWTDSTAVKDAGSVAIVHKWFEQHGGHNILKGNTTILASAIAGYLLTGEPILAKLSEQYCKGLSSTMLGMVHDADDQVLHLMARNVVMANHSYTTHDGREKSVDYANWRHPYDRWNCSRFQYLDNPYWGEVWVTNTRSKDGLGYVLWASALVEDAAERAPEATLRSACAETRDLLALFARDIVDNGYRIRSKDSEGQPYTPGKEQGPPEADTGDLASFVEWDRLFPDAECNNKAASALLAYGDPRDIKCSPLGGDSVYELLSVRNNAPNGHIMRAFHISRILLALLRGHDGIALSALAGLHERFTRDRDMDLTEVNSSPERWRRDLAINQLQAAGAGYPLSPDEVRLIHRYFLRAAESFRAFPNRDIWAASVPDGEHNWLPPSSESGADGAYEIWMGPEALGLLYTWCWSPFRSPHGTALVNCDILSPPGG